MDAEEIVRRLRCRVIGTYVGDGVMLESIDTDIEAAADLIERQAKALEKAEKALIPFSCEAEIYEPDDGDSLHVIWGKQRLKIGNLRAARAAISAIRALKGE